VAAAGGSEPTAGAAARSVATLGFLERFGIIHPPSSPHMRRAHAAVLAIAVVLYLVELLPDKIPYI
jgi:hypothetical protein